MNGVGAKLVAWILLVGVPTLVTVKVSKINRETMAYQIEESIRQGESLTLQEEKFLHRYYKRERKQLRKKNKGKRKL